MTKTCTARTFHPPLTAFRSKSNFKTTRHTHSTRTRACKHSTPTFSCTTALGTHTVLFHSTLCVCLTYCGARGRASSCSQPLPNSKLAGAGCRHILPPPQCTMDAAWVKLAHAARTTHTHRHMHIHVHIVSCLRTCEAMTNVRAVIRGVALQYHDPGWKLNAGATVQ